jgi:lipoprotein-anchoring transpeptidase ErfK/SrfK
MVRRAIRAGGLLLCVSIAAAFAATPARAETTSERVAREQRQTKASIACHRAFLESRPCRPAASRVAPPAPQRAPSASGQERRQRRSRSTLIDVSIGEQVLRAYQDGDLIMQTPVSTGTRGLETPTGTFSIQSKERMHWSRQFGVWMPFAMQVVGGIYIHELPLTEDGRRIGTRSLGTPASHGCIRVGVGDAEALYNWAPIGTPVVIH